MIYVLVIVSDYKEILVLFTIDLVFTLIFYDKLSSIFHFAFLCIFYSLIFLIYNGISIEHLLFSSIYTSFAFILFISTLFLAEFLSRRILKNN